ncbi:MAG TPA: 30S ribosomal protein S11 [Patescibacteria group bacterium]|nr:30S ribosomal protein S11 [Patescibacteria group bacterium]
MAEETPKTTDTTVPATASTAVDDTAVAEKPATPKKRKVKRAVASGQVHVLASFNNTIITFTDPKGGVLSWSSAGSCGFRGSKKGTAYAAQVASEKAGQTAKQFYGFSKADVFVKGIGLGRDAAIRSLQNLDIQVESIHDVTGVPHGGVRPRKARRV